MYRCTSMLTLSRHFAEPGALDSLAPEAASPDGNVSANDGAAITPPPLLGRVAE